MGPPRVPGVSSYVAPSRAAQKNWALDAAEAPTAATTSAPFSRSERLWLKLLSESVGLERPPANPAFAAGLPAIPLPGCLNAEADARRRRLLDEQLVRSLAPTEYERAAAAHMS